MTKMDSQQLTREDNRIAHNDLRQARYIALETFRRNVQGGKTPVWQAPEGDKGRSPYLHNAKEIFK